VLASNTPSRRLLDRVCVRLPEGDGVLDGEGSLRRLDPPRVDRGAVLALAPARSATAADEHPCA